MSIHFLLHNAVCDEALECCSGESLAAHSRCLHSLLRTVPLPLQSKHRLTFMEFPALNQP